MQIATADDLGRVVRERRQELRWSQTELASAARVSRRWLFELESGKATAQVGLILRTLGALGLALDVAPAAVPEGIDLDALLADLGGEADG